jgi:hypothetical protein
LSENVHILPGVARPDLVEKTGIDEILASVRDAGLKDVAIVGRGLNGEVSVWASQTDADAVIGLLMRGVIWLGSGTQVT